MSNINTDKLAWQESMNGVTIDCSLAVEIHPAASDTILLTIPGVDGSVDGYENKYIRMVEAMQAKQNIAAVRIENPFITSFHWESNPRHALAYVKEHLVAITGNGVSPKIKVVAHSAGAAIIARIAHEYSEITDMLLINPAQKLEEDSIREGLKKTKANIIIVFGSKDPSVGFSEALRGDGHKVVVLDGVDHNFTNYLKEFIELPKEYLA